MRPHRRQPTRLRRPWDSPGKNTGVVIGHIFLTQRFYSSWIKYPVVKLLRHRVKWKWSEVAQLSVTLCDPMDCSPPGSSIHGIFQARVLEWGAIAFSRGSSWPRDRTRVSCIVVRRFTIWARRDHKVGTWINLPNHYQTLPTGCIQCHCLFLTSMYKTINFSTPFPTLGMYNPFSFNHYSIIIVVTITVDY